MAEGGEMVIFEDAEMVDCEETTNALLKIRDRFTLDTDLLACGELNRNSYISRLRTIMQSAVLFTDLPEACALRGQMHAAIAGLLVEGHDFLEGIRELDKAKEATGHQCLFEMGAWDFILKFRQWLSNADNVKNNSEELLAYVFERLQIADDLFPSNLEGAIVEYGLCLTVAAHLWSNRRHAREAVSCNINENNNSGMGCTQEVDNNLLAGLYQKRALAAFLKCNETFTQAPLYPAQVMELQFWRMVLPNMEMEDIKQALDYSGYGDAEVLTLAAQIHSARQKHTKALEFVEIAMKLDPENESIQSCMEMIQARLKAPAAETPKSKKGNIQQDFLEGTNISTVENQRKRRKLLLERYDAHKNKPKTKQTTKLVPRRGQPVQRAQETTCRKEKASPSSRFGQTENGSRRKTPLTRMGTFENQQKRKLRKEASKSTYKSLDIIHLEYENKLACDSCCLEERSLQGHWGYHPLADHNCSENILLLRPWKLLENKWFRVRQRPRNVDVDNGICEPNKLGEMCKERPCPYPHNDGELYVWSKNISVGTMVSEFKGSNLQLKSALQNLIKRHFGTFDFLCRTCVGSSEGNLSELMKERHKPACNKGHPMGGEANNQVMYFLPKAGGFIPIEPSHPTEGLPSRVNLVVQDLTRRGFRQHEIVEESKRCAQSVNELAKNKNIQKLISSDRMRTSSQSSQGSNRSDAEVPVLNSEDIVEGHEAEIDWLMEDAMNNADDTNEDEDVAYNYGNGLYYEIQDSETLQTALESDPDRYRQCMIHLEGPQKGRCTTLNGQEVIEIRGRMNCGPTFEGDMVLVEIMETPELDKETSVIRGKVVGVFNRSVNRKSHIFVCSVDPFFSNLMIPVCGTCPKVHVVDSYINGHYGDKKNNYVEVNRFTTELELQKVIKIDPAKKEQLLFVVKYLKWEPSQIYPLGYVCSVMPAGRDMKSGQRVLNLMYQVPGPHTPDIETHVELQEFVYESLLQESEGREDLTDEVVISIDPDGCKDVDDALSVSENGDDTYSVGVHIADVSSFFKDGDIIDVDAQKRATSFYAADPSISYPMLPTRLSHNLCSLLQDKKRCALSVLFQLSARGELVQSPQIKKTWIMNKGKLTYADAQQCILKQGNEIDPEICSKIRMLHRLAQVLRKARLGDALFFIQSRDLADEDEDAHSLVEEFMLLTNRAIADFLLEEYSSCIPLRKQEHPRDDALLAWKDEFLKTAENSFYFKQFENLLTGVCEVEDKGGKMILLKQVITQLHKALEDRDVNKVRRLFGAESFHPLHAIALRQWYAIQNHAYFVAAGMEDETHHFSLQLSCYTQFTSPIRRYMDIVVHRLVHAALDNEDNPYSMDKLNTLCFHVNKVYGRAKKHSKASQQLKKTCELMKTPSYLPGIIRELTDGHTQLLFPHLPDLKSRQRELGYRNLDVAVKPDVTEDTVNLTWNRRIYDARGFHPFAKTKCTMKESVKLDPNTNLCNVPTQVWKAIQKAIITKDQRRLCDLASEVVVRSGMQETKQELTSEMQEGIPIVKHHASFSRELKQGSVVLVQMAAECKKGLLQPTIRLLNFTDECDMCIQHMKDPVSCFADVATNHLKTSYHDIEDYQQVVQPILKMEAACNSVAESDPIVISNAQISLRLSNGKFRGQLKLHKSYCKPRHITLLKNSKDEESDSQDFMCLRCPFKDGTEKKQMWVGHAVQTNASTTDNDDVVVEFGIHHMNEQPPAALTDGRTHCHIELLAKNLPDRRMEDAVKELPNSNDLCRSIVLGQKAPIPKEEWTKLCPRILDIKVDSKCPPLPKNNERQNTAIRKALTQTFTLIQGPPGTGKTVTGIKLAYWYCQLNANLVEEHGGPRRQVLYCGPSNSAVDVAARMLQERLGSKCPKIIRVYSGVLQNQVFPIPRDVNVVTKRDRNYQMLGKEGQKSVVLHFLIRQETNTYHAKIIRFDKMFMKLRKQPEEVTDEQITEYQKLVTDASMEEIKKYDIVLCTCPVSASPVMVRAANITQVIIDECGMCMEPESLVPLVAHKTIEQVVLVGDHRQLRPIVKNATARELGLERSLFERYGDRAIMLNEQYRMHNEICAFPSEHFYDGNLKSPLPSAYVKPSMMVQRVRIDQTRYKQEVNIWPNSHVPLVFCHVEGAEKTLSVSTAEGNEQSKSNEFERDHATRIYRELVNNYKVPKEKVTILTQYKAQCSEIQRTLADYGFEKPRVSTVVSSQGGEWDYVIMSTVRSMPTYEIDKRPSIGWLQKNLGFIIDHHQINVALTRAIKGLIIVGNKNLLRCDGMWRALLNYYTEKRCVVPADDFLQTRSRTRYHRNIHHNEIEQKRLYLQTQRRHQ